MKKTLFCLITLALATGSTLLAEVVRPAPDFPLPTVGSNASLRGTLDGQPVVILFDDSPRAGAFKKQAKLLEQQYRFFAGRDTVFLAVFSDPEVDRVESDIPFVVVPNGGGVSNQYGVEPGKFGLAVIGPDGNIDLVTQEVVSGEWILAVIDNTYEVQEAARE
jgi:hypothetical protein